MYKILVNSSSTENIYNKNYIALQFADKIKYLSTTLDDLNWNYHINASSISLMCSIYK